MEVFSLVWPVVFVLLVLGICQGHGRSEWEDEAQYRHFNPTPKPAREVHEKSTSLLPTDTSVAVVKIPGKALSTRDLGQETYVYSVMQIRQCHCFQTQTVDEVREIMRERNLPYLVVLDHNRRIVGIVTMDDLNRGKKQDPGGTVRP
jgi:CBS domain